MSTMQLSRNPSPAGVCRHNGWTAGTRLAGDEGYGVTVIEITAVGESSILAKGVSHKGDPVRWGEGSWTLANRDWVRIA